MAQLLNLLDRSLESFLRSEVPLGASEVDISFEAPDKDWGAGITKPTVNLFVWDVRRNAEESESGFSIVENEKGLKERRPPLPRVDFRYLVTAWTTEIMDEHALLGGVLATLLKEDRLDAPYLEGSLAEVTPVPSMRIATAYSDDKSEFWSALGGQLKPGLDLIVTATIDAVEPFFVGPPVTHFEMETRDTDGHALSSRVVTADPSATVADDSND